MAKKINNNMNEEILAFLRQDELDYPGAAKKFGAAAVPFLQEITEGGDENLSTKAAYLLGYIDDAAAKSALVTAAANKFTTVRIAAAYSAASQDTETAKSILGNLLNDHDYGVIKVAMRSIDEKRLATGLSKELKAVQKRALPVELKEQVQKMLK
ncbi:MAG: HEAT repeat domain-containing protein [Niabella sp.]